MKPFRMLAANEHDELLQLMMKDHLLLAVFILCAIRARRIKEVSPVGLKQGEFFLAETECDKFGIKPTQGGQLRRKLLILHNRAIIQKTESRIGNDGATVWRFLPNSLIDLGLETENDLENEQRTNRERIERNYNDKNDKKKNKKEKLSPLPYAEIWRIANDLQIPIGYVVRKHQTIMDKVDHGDFPHSSIPLTLRNWLRGDLDKGYVKTVDETGKLELQAYSPENQKIMKEAIELQKEMEA